MVLSVGGEYRYLTGYTAPQLLINEIVVENDVYFVDPDEALETPDWVELYNPGAAPVSLDGVRLPTTRMSRCASHSPGFSIPPGGRMIILADDDVGQNIIRGNQPPLHMPFNLNKGDAFVGLYGGEGTVLIDSRVGKESTADPRRGPCARRPGVVGDRLPLLWRGEFPAASGSLCPQSGSSSE